MLGMPRRKARVSLTPVAHAGASLASLPDDVLLAVFAKVPLQDRHRSLPLVCRRWRGVASRAALLASVHAQLGAAHSTRALFLPCLRAFVRWLRCVAAPHAASVQLDIHVPHGTSRSGLRLAFGELKECLAASCRQLSALRLHLNQEVHASSWLGQLAGLTALHLASSDRLLLSADLGGCRALRELSLSGGRGLRLAPDAALPPTLRVLELQGLKAEVLPPQVAGLTGLSALTLSTAHLASSALAPLSQLSRLENLRLLGCHEPPPSAVLAALSSLRSLEVELGWCQVATAGDSSTGGNSCAHSHGMRSGSDAGRGGPQASCFTGAGGGGRQEAAFLQEALQGLTQLTRLRFASTQQHSAFPPALAGLHRLQQFEWAGAAPANPCLPAGPWLARLRSTALPAGAAASSLAVLSATWQLEALSAAGVEVGAAPSHPEIVRWAARHPPLQRLAMLGAPCSQAGATACTAGDDGSNGLSGGISRQSSGGAAPFWQDLSFATALQEAAEQRPGLAVRCG